MHPATNPAPAAQNPPHRARTVRPDPAPDSFAARVRDTMHRLKLDEYRAADYFGVPVFTLRKWCSGEREPGAAVLRLFDVLGMVEALAPGLHAALTPPATAPKRPRGRPKTKAD